MKNALVIFSFFLNLTVCAQKQKLVSVEISIKDCRTNQHLFGYSKIDTIFFHELTRDSSFKIIVDDFDTNPIELNNISIGNYSIRYNNSFGQEIIKAVEISDNDSNFINICSDSLVDYKQNSLNRLENGDSIVINYASFGCFHASSKIIILMKSANQITARLYDANAHFGKKKNQDKLYFKKLGLLKEIKLSSSNIAAFIRFENELNFINDGGCTTMDWYEVVTRNSKIEKVDATCNWSGFTFLALSIFGEVFNGRLKLDQ